MNKDIVRRDKLLFGTYDPEKYMGGIRHFTCSRDVIEKLIEEDFIELDERQNYSPSTQEFMDMTDPEYGLGNVRFHGYAVGSNRDDYRVTIDAIDVEVSDDDFDNLISIIRECRSADEFDIEHNSPSFFLHAWWD